MAQNQLLNSNDRVTTIVLSPLTVLVWLVGVAVISFGLFKIISGIGSGGSSIGVNDSGSGAVTLADGKQVVTILVAGGYSPRKVTAKAGVPTILIMRSQNAYGCERAFRISKLGISQVLPQSGDTQFDLGTQTVGTKLVGSCSMGMYTTVITFN